MKILHINFSDCGGGAEEFSFDLVHKQKNALLYVKKKQSNSSRVKELPKPDFQRLYTILDKISWKLGFKKSFRAVLGIQDCLHQTAKKLMKLADFKEADIVHLHNIHGEFFDLKALNQICKVKAIVWTSHDMWLMTGGEGFIFLDMTKAQKLHAYPIRNPLFDTRGYFKTLKKNILTKNSERITLVSPSRYHHDRLNKYFERLPITVVPYGIDTTMFSPAAELENETPKVLIFNSKSIYKNSIQVISAIEKINSAFMLYVLGEELILQKKNLAIKNLGYIAERREIAHIFKQIDIGIFSSKEETFGLLPAELAASGAKIFLNQDLRVFSEHANLYNASLFANEDELVESIKSALENISQIRIEGEISAAMVAKNLNRQNTIEKYNELYQKAVQ
jgi:glycosyltransferase involved in cell wall biosynthesis